MRFSFQLFGKREPAVATRENSQTVNVETIPQTINGPESFEAVRRSGFRGYVYFPNLAPQRHITPMTRLQLAIRAQWLYDNVGLAKMFVDKTTLHEAGVGIWPKPRTSKSKWNRYVADYFHDQYSDPSIFDVAGMVSYYSAQNQIRDHIKVHGDHFGVNARVEGQMAQMKFYPGAQVRDALPSPYPLGEAPGWVDGTLLDAGGRLQKIRVCNPDEPLQYTDIEARYVQHYYDHLWTGQARGISMLHAAAAKMLTIDDILFYEQNGVRLTSQHGYILYVPSNDDPIARPLPGADATETVEKEDGSKLTVQEIFKEGSTIPRLPPGYKLETLKSDRPAASFTGFLDYLVRDCANGSRYSPQFLYFITEAGGAVVRFILDEARLRIDETQQNQLIPQFCRPTYRYWLWHEMKRGALEYPGDDWWRADYMCPRSATMDKGREGALDDNRFSRGQIGPNQYYAPLALDPEDVEEDVIRSAARKRKRVEEIAKEEGVTMTYDDVFPRPVQLQQPAPEPQNDPEPAKKS